MTSSVEVTRFWTTNVCRRAFSPPPLFTKTVLSAQIHGVVHIDTDGDVHPSSSLHLAQGQATVGVVPIQTLYVCELTTILPGQSLKVRGPTRYLYFFWCAPLFRLHAKHCRQHCSRISSSTPGCQNSNADVPRIQ